MEPKQLVALALILLGGHFLLSNLGILPSLKVFWPVILIVVGLAALYQNSGKPKKTVTKDGEVIYEIDGDSTALKFLVAFRWPLSSALWAWWFSELWGRFPHRFALCPDVLF